jgi:hypothetical protein
MHCHESFSISKTLQVLKTVRKDSFWRLRARDWDVPLRETKFTRGKDVNTIVSGFGWMNDYDKEVTNISEFTRVATA